MQQSSAAATTALQYEHDYILQTYPRPDFVLESGEGIYLYDTDGRQYLDFVAGIAVNALGYRHPAVVAAIHAAADGLLHVSNLYHTVPGGELARHLIASAPAFDRVFFCNSGTEAIEGAIKFTRKFARTYSGEGKTTIVAFDGSFHGRTMGAVALTARDKYRAPFMPVMPDVRFAPYNDLDGLAAVMDDSVCAVFVEPVQGEGGLRVASSPFLAGVRELCDRHHALLVVDEIQCGMGRTGTLWAYTASNIRPDIMTIAKPLAGGLPIGAILLNDCVATAIKPGDHGTTFGGGPFITAVARVVFEYVRDPAFLAQVRSIGDYFGEALHAFARQHPTVRDVRGCGLMRGVQIDGDAAQVRMRAHDEGLLIATAGPDIVRMLPPLIVTPDQIDDALTLLARVL